MKLLTRTLLFCLAMVFLVQCQPNEQTTSPPPLPDFGAHRTVGIVVVNGVYNSELFAPLDLFHHTIFHADPAMKVFLVAPTLDPITSFEGQTISPDFTFDHCPPIDVLVVPSAEHSMDTDLDNEALISFVKERGAKAEYLLSLCDGAFVLAQAGLLDEVTCTTFPSDVEAFKTRFPQLDVKEGVSFVHDDNAITSAGGARSYNPAMYLIHLLYGEQVAIGVGKGMVINWSTEKFEAYKELPLATP